MKKFYTILTCIIIASTQFGCLGTESYDYYTYESGYYTPPSGANSFGGSDYRYNYVDYTSPTVCKAGDTQCESTFIQSKSSISLTKASEELRVINNSKDSITVTAVTFANGSTMDKNAGLTISRYIDDPVNSYRLPYKIIGRIMSKVYFYNFVIRATDRNNKSSSSSSIRVEYTTKDGINKTVYIGLRVDIKIQVEDPRVEKIIKEFNALKNGSTDRVSDSATKQEKKAKTRLAKELAKIISLKNNNDYYGVFGLSSTKQYSCDDIKTRNRNLIKITHPDKKYLPEDMSNDVVIRINDARDKLNEIYKCGNST